MTILLEKKNVAEGEAFYNTHLPAALKKAQTYAGKQGYVASLPELVRARILASPDQEIWTNFYTANSEEDIGATKQGKPILLVVHGNGILSSPERIERAYQDGLINRAARLFQEEVVKLSEGRLPNEQVIPVHSFSEFRQGIRNLPRNYAIVMDLDEAKRTKSGVHKIKDLLNSPLFIARAGGLQTAEEYLRNVEEKLKVSKYGSWHPFDNVDINQPQGRLLFLDINYDNCFNGLSNLGNDGRFVGVRAPEISDLKTESERKPTEITLEKRIRVALEKGEAFKFDGRLYVPVSDKRVIIEE